MIHALTAFFETRTRLSLHRQLRQPWKQLVQQARYQCNTRKKEAVNVGSFTAPDFCYLRFLPADDCLQKTAAVLLLNRVDSFAQTGNFSGSIVLMVNALGRSLADCRNGICQSALCSFLVSFCHCSLYLLDRSFNGGFSSLISGSFLLAYKDSFLCGFNVSQTVHLLLDL